jgi:inner membrane protease subunit 1
MSPTMDGHSVVLIDRLGWRWRGLKRGDIVVAVQPTDNTVSICKRVTGLAGDMKYGMRVPEGCVWLEGDNRGNSFDSRHHGPVPEWMVRGRVLAVLL